MQQDFKQSRLKDLEKIIGKEQDRLFRFAYMRVGNREDAEDIVQDVFLKLFASDENLHHVRNLEHYLLRSISNCCLDYHRKKTFDIVSIDEAGQVAEETEDQQIHDEYLRINKILATLSDEQAEIVRLKVLRWTEISGNCENPRNSRSHGKIALSLCNCSPSAKH